MKPLSKLAEYLTLIFNGVDLKRLEDERYDEDEDKGEPDEDVNNFLRGER